MTMIIVFWKIKFKMHFVKYFILIFFFSNYELIINFLKPFLEFSTGNITAFELLSVAFRFIMLMLLFK